LYANTRKGTTVLAAEAGQVSDTVTGACQKAGLRNLLRLSGELLRFLRTVEVAQEVNEVIARTETSQRHLEAALKALWTDLAVPIHHGAECT
jgi:hypothetical protein